MAEKRVTAKAFSTLWEAGMACSRLEVEGMAACLKDGRTINMNWFFYNALGGVKVQVVEGELERAREILSAPRFLDAPNGAGTEHSVTCPRCKKEDARLRISGRPLAFLT